MRKMVFLLTMALLVVVLLTSGVGVAAEPQKNQILVPASCGGQSYTFVINGMSKVGQILGSTNNIAIKRFTVTYFNPEGDRIGGDTFDQGNKKGLQGDLINCAGRTTTELQGLGVVTAVFKFQGFVTPRGK